MGIFGDLFRKTQIRADVNELFEQARHASEATRNYQRTGQRNALDIAISSWELVLSDPAFSKTPQAFQLAVCNDAGSSYSRRYKANGEPRDLNRSIVLCKQAVAATAPNPLDHAGYLSNLGANLNARYRRDGPIADLQAAIEAYQQAVAAMPSDARERARYCNNLGTALVNLYKQNRRDEDLNAGIAAYQQALASPERTYRLDALDGLGGSLYARYRYNGTLDDLAGALEYWQQAVVDSPLDTLKRGSSLSCFANSPDYLPTACEHPGRPRLFANKRRPAVTVANHTGNPAASN